MKKIDDTDEKDVRQRYFVARELQLSIALLTVLALLGGIFLQSVSKALMSHFNFQTPALGVFLIIGYIIIVVLIAVFFTHRLVGPFKRLEYEMKIIRSGELDKRLSIRSQDDPHVSNFVKYINDFIASFEDMSKGYSKLNSTVSIALDEVLEELSKDECDREKVKKRLEELRKDIHRLRERW